jgi:hypothetical protein
LDQQDQLAVVEVVNLQVGEDFLEEENFLVVAVGFLEEAVAHHHKYQLVLLQHYR